MNVLLTSVGRRSYLVEYFKQAVGEEGTVVVTNSAVSQAWTAADKAFVSPVIYDEGYIPFLLNLCREEEIGVLVSLFDIDLPVLAAHRKEFEEIGTFVVVSEPEVIEICNDKWKTYTFLLENGFLAPRTYLRPDEAVKALEAGEISFPVMVKPRWGMGSLALYRADNRKELEIFYEKTRKNIGESYLKYEAVQAPESCVLIQECLAGQEYGMDVINDLDGNYRNAVQKRKDAMRSGETDSAETVEIPALRQIGERISVLLKHRGNLDMDLFEKDGEFYILELNARFGGGYPFSHMAGVNLPQAIINWSRGMTAGPELLTAQTGIKGYKDIRMVCLNQADR
ncbi:ATP-grasp domain-containing protein [Clostridium sp. MCC353]|uniref:ATP-grasp domain-containing protein n=1 Tax=Clostridium sp. MCC353 TaxID=2592646 RepID=UPI001C027AB8|nr:ATP-grasp domain-containing protein [Clostridium sp. MCC353]MBT9778365.1 ATP-grasp domain-containing protein [Clostridium sp. MCC353]